MFRFASNHSFSCDIWLSFQLRLRAESVQINLKKAQQVSAAIWVVTLGRGWLAMAETYALTFGFRFAGLAAVGLFVFSGCKTSAFNGSDSSLRDVTSIQTMTRSGDNYDITCIDGTSQVIPIAEFPNKDPREICPGIAFSECGQRVVYSNGRELKAANGTFYYPTGAVALANDGSVRYFNGQSLTDSNNNLFFADGSLLQGQNSSLMYPEGNTLRNTSGAVFYPDKTSLSVPNGGLKYPGNLRMMDENGNFYYGDERSRRLKVGDAIYYKDGSVARSGQTLYRPEDRKQTPGPIIIEEPIGDGAVVRGLIRFNVLPTQFTYFIDLPKLHPNVSARYESKKNSWYFRYQLTNADYPIHLTFDGKSISKVLYLKTGYVNSTVVVDFSKSPVMCRLVNTAAQGSSTPR